MVEVVVAAAHNSSILQNNSIGCHRLNKVNTLDGSIGATETCRRYWT